MANVLTDDESPTSSNTQFRQPAMANSTQSRLAVGVPFHTNDSFRHIS